MDKKILIPTLGLAFVTALAVLGVTAVKADETQSYPPIVARIAEKFGLSESDVNAVFDEERQERQEGMLQRREERLDEAVADGVITEEQKTLIQEKWQEMFNEKEQEKQAHHDEMQAWFEENGIDEQAFMGYMGQGGPGMHGGFGPGMGFER